MRNFHVYLAREINSTTLYINHNGSEDICFFSKLSTAVCKLLKKVYDIQSQIQDLLLCQNPDRISEYLVENGYVTDEGNYSYFIPPVGIEIPESDLHFLDQNPNYFFRPGEFVGYELDSIGSKSVYIYARIVKEVKLINETVQPYFIRRYEINIAKEETIVASSLDLYKIKQQKHHHIVPNNISGSINVEIGSLSKSLHETCEDVSKQLEGILSDATLTEEQKRKAIRRLYLLWHPDKNIGNEEYAGEVFKHIKNELERLEKGLSKSQYSSGSSSATSEKGFSYSYGFSSSYDKWDREARAGCEQEQQWFSDRSSSSTGTFSSDSSYQYYKPKPNPTEGKRWFRQANADIHAASKDMEGDCSSFEWVCFKCQQAVEKALKGGIYTVLGDLPDSKTHDLLSLASTLSTHINRDVTNDAGALLNLRCDHLHPRYPDMYGGTRIPNDAYTQETATKALEYAKRILNEVAIIINTV
ncbi:sacsin-like [Saccoglossus kowalevskii]